MKRSLFVMVLILVVGCGAKPHKDVSFDREKFRDVEVYYKANKVINSVYLKSDRIVGSFSVGESSTPVLFPLFVSLDGTTYQFSRVSSRNYTIYTYFPPDSNIGGYNCIVFYFDENYDIKICGQISGMRQVNEKLPEERVKEIKATIGKVVDALYKKHFFKEKEVLKKIRKMDALVSYVNSRGFKHKDSSFYYNPYIREDKLTQTYVLLLEDVFSEDGNRLTNYFFSILKDPPHYVLIGRTVYESDLVNSRTNELHRSILLSPYYYDGFVIKTVFIRENFYGDEITRRQAKDISEEEFKELETVIWETVEVFYNKFVEIK